METGTIINQYKIISAIGKGGMGEISLAHNRRCKGKVALTLLSAEFTQDVERGRKLLRCMP